MSKTAKTVLKNFRFTVPVARRIEKESRRTGRTQKRVVLIGLKAGYGWMECAK